MIELVLVLVGVVGLSALALLPWLWLLQGGAALVALGLFVGMPAGVVYHVQLHQELRAVGQLGARWWLQPIAQHVHLDDAGRERIRFMCGLGAAGCGVAFVGCLVIAVALVRSAGGLA